MHDFHIQYDEAVKQFLEFLQSQGCSQDVRWFTRDRQAINRVRGVSPFLTTARITSPT